MTNVRTDDWFERVALPRPGSFGFLSRASFVVALVLSLVLLSVFGQGKAGWEERLLACAIMALAAVPLWLWMSGRDRTLPLMAFVAMIYAAQYALSIFFLPAYVVSIDTLSDASVIKALELAIAGLACLMAGYYGPQRRIIDRVVPCFEFRWRSYNNVKFWGFVFSFVGLPMYLVNLVYFVVPTQWKAFQQFIVFGAQLCEIGACMLFALQLVGGLGRSGKILLWVGIVPVRILLGLGNGTVAAAFTFTLVLLVLYTTFSHSIPWKTLIAGLIAVILVRPLMTPFRGLTRENGFEADASPIRKSELFMQMAPQFGVGGTASYEFEFQYSFARLSCTTVFAAMLRDTPDHVPYWRGATYYPILFKPIPRLLYPDKPIESTDFTVGQRYGLLPLSDRTTSFHLPQLVELYVNFGLTGILLGMTLYGMIYRAAVRAFVHPRMGFGGAVAASYICSGFLVLQSVASAIECSASWEVGQLMWSCVFIGLVHLIVESTELNSRAGDIAAPGRL